MMCMHVPKHHVPSAESDGLHDTMLSSMLNVKSVQAASSASAMDACSAGGRATSLA